jgi:geranylgeranyl diphosphate synthase, type II
MAFNLFSDEIEKALPAALAVEVFHNFTLLHDDIMDKAEVRRNKPTVHLKFSENNAILSGDAMAFLSYQYLFETNSERMFHVANLFTKTALEVCEGQQYDMDFENRLDVTEAEYLEMIRLKTAVLLGCSMQAGALLANAADETAQQLYNFGINLGMAFNFRTTGSTHLEINRNLGKKLVATL